MSGFYKERKLTKEEQELETALDQHRDAFKDEKNVMSTAGVLYLLGLVLIVIGHGQIERAGVALFVSGLVCLAGGMLLQLRTRKYRIIAAALLDAYSRKKAIPFYNELTEMFAKKPGVHLHLNNNGSITVTDKRKKELK